MRSCVVYITDSLIRFAYTGENQDKPEAVHLHIPSLKKEDIPHAIKNLLKINKIVPERLILGIPRSRANLRYFSFPTVNDSEIRSMVEYDLSSRFAYKDDELVYDHAVIERSAEGFSRVILAAVPREKILPEFTLLKHAGLIPDEGALSTVSLFNQFISRKKNQEKSLLVYFDDGFVEIIYADGGKLEFSRAIDFQPKDPDSLVKEIKHTLSVLQTEGKVVSRAVIAGKVLALKDPLEFFLKSMGLAAEFDDTLDTLKGFLQDGSLKLSLLPEEYKIRKVKEQRTRSLVYLAILALLNLSLVANIVFFKIKTKDEYLFAVRSEIKKIEGRANVLQKKMAKVRILQSYINSGRLKLGLLSEIYRGAPDGIILNSLDINGEKGQGSIILIGQAQDSESVLKFTSKLKSSSFIEKTDVNYINKRRMPAQNAVDFEMRASF